MQIITEIPDGKPGRPDYQGSWFLKRQPGRDLPKKDGGCHRQKA